MNGARFRQSLDTTDWREALSREKEKIAEASAGKLAPTSQLFSRLSFSEAVERYLADRLARIQPKTAKAERERATVLKTYFAAIQVSRISGRLRAGLYRGAQAGRDGERHNQPRLGRTARRA